MLTLDSTLHIPAHISFSIVGEDAFLLNTRTSKYFALEEVGARLLEILAAGKSLQECFQALLVEYEVGAPQLEQDLLELLEKLREQGLVEIDPI
jgi:hypothetical protein